MVTVTTFADDPPPGFTWTKDYPKTSVVGQFMVIEGDGYYVAPKGYTLEKIRFRTQACKAGLPGVRDPNERAVDWDAKLGAGQQPGPLGFKIYCTPEKNMKTAIFDANKTYVVEFVVNIKDDKGNLVAENAALAPSAVAGPPAQQEGRK